MNSLDKVIGVYLASVCAEPFTYGVRRFEPKPLVISPLLVRGYTCPTQCGACCGSFSLDYLPSEQTPVPATPSSVVINGRTIECMTDTQTDVLGYHCRNLTAEARCGIHAIRPLSCDFELIRFLVFDDHVLLTQKLFGRAWNMLRIDGERGTLCEMLPADLATIAEVVRKLHRLEAWGVHLGIKTRIPDVIYWLEHTDCLTQQTIPIPGTAKIGFFQ